ncbi:MAG: hypothetical protein JST39_24345, partial [Bacteroidetes bacterium]|nr:hypothetical protein [Bacteroidota bacterium]
MELDDFKTLLKTKLEAEAPVRSTAELEQAIQGRTMSVLDKVRRSILWELVLGFVLVAAGIWIWVRFPSFSNRCFSTLMGLLCIFFMIRLGRLYRSILHFGKNDQPVRERLREIIRILQQFTRLYFRFSMSVLPVAFMLGLATGYADVMHQPLLAQNFHWARGLAAYIVLFGAWSIIAYLFSKWY